MDLTSVGDAPLRVPLVVQSENEVGLTMKVELPIRKHPRLENYDYSQKGVYFITFCVKDKQNLLGVVGIWDAPPTKATIPQVVQSIKSMTTKHFGFSLWQRSYHDHIIRNHDEYLRIWKYIDENPALWSDDIYFVQN